jgi:hypothetical protein
MSKINTTSVEPVYQPLNQNKESDQVIELKEVVNCPLSYDDLSYKRENYATHFDVGQCMCGINRTDKGRNMASKDYEILDVTVHKNSKECYDCFLKMALEHYNRGYNVFGRYFLTRGPYLPRPNLTTYELNINGMAMDTDMDDGEPPETLMLHPNSYLDVDFTKYDSAVFSRQVAADVVETLREMGLRNAGFDNNSSYHNITFGGRDVFSLDPDNYYRIVQLIPLRRTILALLLIFVVFFAYSIYGVAILTNFENIECIGEIPILNTTLDVKNTTTTITEIFKPGSDTNEYNETKMEPPMNCKRSALSIIRLLFIILMGCICFIKVGALLTYWTANTRVTVMSFYKKMMFRIVWGLFLVLIATSFWFGVFGMAIHHQSSMHCINLLDVNPSNGTCQSISGAISFYFSAYQTFDMLTITIPFLVVFFLATVVFFPLAYIPMEYVLDHENDPLYRHRYGVYINDGYNYIK